MKSTASIAAWDFFAAVGDGSKALAPLFGIFAEVFVSLGMMT